MPRSVDLGSGGAIRGGLAGVRTERLLPRVLLSGYPATDLRRYGHAAMNDSLLDEMVRWIPASIGELPGTAIYSGRDAWQAPAEIYFLGFNPGGDPSTDALTVSEQMTRTLVHEKSDFSKYVDERWSTRSGRLYAKGEHPMQVRVRDLFAILGLSLGMVPTSNVIFARSRQVAHLEDPRAWADACWPFHAEVIRILQPQVILCMGNDAATFVASKTPGPEVVKVRHTSRSPRTWGPDAAPVVQAALDRTSRG